MSTRSGTHYYQTYSDQVYDPSPRRAYHETVYEPNPRRSHQHDPEYNLREPHHHEYNPRYPCPDFVDQDDRAMRDIRIEVPTFDGHSNPEVYLDWERKIDQYFDWNEMSEKRKYQFAKSKLVRKAKLYWEQVEWLDRLPIVTWRDLKIRLREKYLPRSYHQRLLDQFVLPITQTQPRPPRSGLRPSLNQTPIVPFPHVTLPIKRDEVQCNGERYTVGQCPPTLLRVPKEEVPEIPRSLKSEVTYVASQNSTRSSPIGELEVEVYEADPNLVDEYEEQEVLIEPEPAEECVERMTYEEEPEAKPESPEECGEAGEELVVEEETAEETPIEPELTKECDEETVYEVGVKLVDEYIGELEENDSEPIEPLGNFINQVDDNLIDVEKIESSDLPEEFKADLSPVAAEEVKGEMSEGITIKEGSDQPKEEHPREVVKVLEDFYDDPPHHPPPLRYTLKPSRPHWDIYHTIDLVPVIFNYYFWKTLWHLLGTQCRFTATYLKLCARVFKAM